ncbi:MAG TPA: CBS domain-containing protein [Caldilineales bacterium]|nr:CBS domain-containing protein [Caldilineales bacterium]
MPSYLARDVMTSPAVTIRWDATVLEASALMEERDIRRLPVVDEEDMLIGIVSDGDVREALSIYNLTNPYAPDQDEILLAVDEIMSAPVYAVGPDERLTDVIRIMLDHKIGGVPVVDADRHPLGVITESDIFRLILKEWGAD